MKLAKPVSFLDQKTLIGSVSIVASDGPPLSVKPWTVADGDNKHIAIEFEDIFKKLIIDENSLISEDPTLRVCLHLSDARRLTHHLIHRLAESGDRIAKLIKQKMNESMEEETYNDSEPIDLRRL